MSKEKSTVIEMKVIIKDNGKIIKTYSSMDQLPIMIRPGDVLVINSVDYKVQKKVVNFDTMEFIIEC